MSQPEQREEAVFEAALQLPADQRAAYLDQTCVGDTDLRRRVEALLGAFERAGGFLNQPATPERTVRISPPPTEKPGDRIGRYKLLQQIGEGGCGVVYMAEQEEPVRRRVALKVIKLGMDTKQVIARFEAERQALALMDHPNIARILDAGVTGAPVAAGSLPAVELGFQPGGQGLDSLGREAKSETFHDSQVNPGGQMPPSTAGEAPATTLSAGRPYFVMELVRGVKITEFCDEQQLPMRQRLELFIQVCSAVQHAHQKGIIHRDLKPSNILVTVNDGKAVPKVIDFGIAKATTGQPLTDKTLFTAFEQFLGTPTYMSPEQAVMTSVDIDTRSDIYSLGVLLYELLTGVTPFDTKELLVAGLDAMRRTICEAEPVKPSTRLAQAQELERTHAGKLPLPARSSRGEGGGRGVTDGTTVDPQVTSSPKPSPPSDGGEGGSRASSRRLLREVQGDLDWIVMKCLEKDRARRYETANGLAADLARHLNDEPVTARPPSAGYRMQKFVRRHPVGLVMAAVMFLLLTVGITLTGWQARRAQQAERAERAAQAGAEQARQTALVEAEKARQAAAGEAEKRAAAQAARNALSTSDFLQAVRLVAEDNATDAVAYLVRSLSADPANDAALTRLATLLMYRTWLLPTVVMTNSSALNAVDFSSDGMRLVSAAVNGDVQVWDARTGQPQGEPLKHPTSVTAARFSADARRIVTAWGDLVRVWDAQTGQPLTGPLSDREDEPEVRAGQVAVPPMPTSPTALNRRVLAVQFSQAGDRVLTVSRDRRVRVWEVGSGRLAGGPWQHTNGIVTAEFSVDGKRIETHLRNHQLVEWDVATGQLVGEPVSRTNRADAAQLSPDGLRRLAVANRLVRVLDPQTGQSLTEPMPHDAEVSFAKFSPNGQRVVTVCNLTIRIWDAQTEPARPLRSPIGRDGYWSGRDFPRTEFSPDGRRIVMPAGSNRVCVWEAQTGERLADVTNRNRVNAVGFSPDGLRIVTADDTARVWDARTGQPQGEPMKHDSMIFSARFSPDGRRIVTASADQTSRVWDAQTGQPITGPLKHGDALTLAEFSIDGKRVLTLSSGGESPATARLWNAQTGQPLNEPVTLDETWKDMVLPSSPDGERILTPGNGMVRVWDALTGRPLTSRMVYDPPSTNASLYTSGLSSAAFSPDRKRIFTVSNQRRGERLPAHARVWDAQTGELVLEQLAVGAPGVDSARFTPDGKRIITAVGGKARVWDAQTAQPVTDLLSTGGRADTANFELLASPDGRRIVTSQSGRSAYLWDLAPAAINAPGWLPQLAEVISGKVVNKQGTLETTRLNRTEKLNVIRQKLDVLPDDDWVVWGRWLLADRATRTISPFAKVRVPEYLERLIKENTRSSLNEAEQLAAGKPEVLKRISEARQTLEQPRK